MSFSRRHGKQLGRPAALALARELDRVSADEATTLASFIDFLRREGFDARERRIALGQEEPKESLGDRVRRQFGFLLSGLAAASLVFSIAFSDVRGEQPVVLEIEAPTAEVIVDDFHYAWPSI